MKALIAGLAVVCLLLATSPSFADTQVSDLKQHVKESRAQLQMTRRKWREAQKKLQQVEKNLAVSARALAKTEGLITHNQHAINTKKHDLAVNKKQLARRIGELGQSLRGIDQWLNEPSIKWIMTSNDPGDWSRLATYHRIIGHSQQELIEELKDLQQRIVQDERALEKLAESLKKERAKRRHRLATLRALKSNRKHLVAKLQLSVRDKSRQLKQDESSLQSVLKHFSRSGQAVSGHFSRQKGRLMWPINGRMDKLFNHSIQGSELKWRGVLFEARQGRAVRAVAPGRVVYADWMSGYGWLLIIEHDNGYMTLYGRNHYLYKKTGQTVRRGDIIARSGKSGGFRQAALYFSLRHNGTPLDPAKWLAHKRRA
jgi:murein hydrolase activator